MRALLGSIAISSLLAAPALAADMPVKAAPAPIVAVYSWSGFYIGGQVGYAWGRNHFVVTGVNETTYDIKGAIGGGHVGFMWQTNQIVFGVEGDVNALSVKGDDGGFGGTLDRSKLRNAGSVRGRLGYAWNSWLFYATGGWAITNNSQTRVAIAETVKHTHSGWTVGAGISYALTQNWIAGVEYRHSDYGTKTYNWIASVPTTSDLKTNEVTFRLSYKFGGPVVARY